MNQSKPYFTEGPSVLIKCDKGREFTFGLPTKGNATFVFKQNQFEGEGKEKHGVGDYFCEVPTTIYVIDDFKRKHIVQENFAQHLITSYKDLEAVEAIEPPVINSSNVVEGKQLPVRKKGVKKNE